MMDRITGRAPPSPDPRPDCKLGKSTFTYRRGKIYWERGTKRSRIKSSMTSQSPGCLRTRPAYNIKMKVIEDGREGTCQKKNACESRTAASSPPFSAALRRVSSHRA